MSILPHSRFNPARGGHAPGDLREAFVDAVEVFILSDGDAWPTVELRGQQVSLGQLIGLLWNCTDIMPGTLCRELGSLAVQVTDDGEHKWREGRTYAQGARLISLYTGEVGSARRYAYAHPWYDIASAPKDRKIDILAKTWISESDTFESLRFPDCMWDSGDSLCNRSPCWSGLPKEWHPTHWKERLSLPLNSGTV